jgi:hypothetical protein
MVTHACFDVEGIIRGRQRLSYGVLAIGIEAMVEGLRLLGVEGHQ